MVCNATDQQRRRVELVSKDCGGVAIKSLTQFVIMQPGPPVFRAEYNVNQDIC